MKTRPINLTERDVARLFRSVNRRQGCWEWKRELDAYGYGRFYVSRDGKQSRIKAHRAMYTVLVGPIPEGLTLDHICHNKSCVNPEHLEPVTVQENSSRAPHTVAKRNQTHCKRGHEFTEENTGRDGKGSRFCRQCMRDRTREWKKARVALR